MSKRNYHKQNKNFISSFLSYGFHLWILLFVSNLLIFYSFNLYSLGAETEIAQTEPSPEVSETVSPTVKKTAPPVRVPTKKPNGPVISLSFTVPGIGSGGGTFRPTRDTRNVTVYLYATDVNSNDNKVKPLYSIRTIATYDSNELSPTYTAFVNNYIELGDTVKNGKYQVAFTTEQALRKLVKDKEESIGGKIITLSRFEKAVLPIQQVIMGDTSPPPGNNVMDIADYNVLVECFGKTDCKNFRQSDLNDDGIIDGIDYNIMALGFKTLVAQGFAPPTLPSAEPTQVSNLSELKATSAPSPTATKPSPKPVAASSSNPAGGILLFFVFLIVLGGGFFALTKTKFGKALLATYPLPFMKKSDANKTDTSTSQPADNAAGNNQTAPAEATTEAVAESTEISIESLQAEKAAAGSEAPAAPPAETSPTLPAAPDTNSTIDKTYYVKNKSKDEKGTWVTLTDDAGPIDGLLPTGDIEDGFEHIKGQMKEENGKKYLLISEILPAE